MKRTVGLFLRSRGSLLAIVLIVLGSIMGLLTPVDVAQSAACAFRPVLRSYYSDATYATLVGQRGLDCGCNEVNWGVTSAFMQSTVQCCFYFTC